MDTKRNALRRILCALLIVICMSASVAPAFALQMGDVLQVNTNLTRLRSRPRAGSPVLAKLPKGTKVQFLKNYNGWFLLRLGNGRLGFMYKSFLSPVVSAKVGQLYRSRIKGRLPVFTLPNLHAPLRGSIKNTTQMVLLQRRGVWGLIRVVSNGAIGYVDLRYLAVSG